MPYPDGADLKVLTSAVNGNILLAEALVGFKFKLYEEEKIKTDEQIFAVTKNFLINERGGGTSLQYTIERSKDLYDLDSDSGKNRVFENFFDDYIKVTDEPKETALEDFWLALFQKGAEGAEILRDLVEEVFGKLYRIKEQQNSFLYKYAVHFATELLFALYAAFYDPLDPTSEQTGKSLERFEEKMTEKSEGFHHEAYSRLERLIEHGSIKEMLNFLPEESRQTLKKRFFEIIYSFDNLKDPYKELINSPKKTKNDFDVYTKTSIKKLYELEKQIYFSLGEIDEVDNNDNAYVQPLFIPFEIREKHVLFRLYKLCRPNEFLEYLWLMQDAFELYQIKYKEIYPEQEVRYELRKPIEETASRKPSAFDSEDYKNHMAEFIKEFKKDS